LIAQGVRADPESPIIGHQKTASKTCVTVTSISSTEHLRATAPISGRPTTPTGRRTRRRQGS